MAYAHRYENAETIFGTEMGADFLISRVRSFSWEGIYHRLAELAALVAQHGPDSEVVRRRTVDPLLHLTGDASAAGIIRRARHAVATRRNEIVLAHEEAISYLQHLALLEGGGGEEAPAAAELSLWLGGVGSHLGKWQREDRDAAGDAREGLIASLAHNLRFNNEPDPAQLLVRAALLFRRPARGALADPEVWRRVQEEAFEGPYEEFLETALGPLFIFSKMWGDETSAFPWPVIDTTTYLREAKVDPERIAKLLGRLAADREMLRAEIRERLRPDGLPHSPTALLYRPLVRTQPTTFVAASPWAVQLQLRTGVWYHFLQGTKRLSPRVPENAWFTTFGNLLEDWCRDLAKEAGHAPFCRARFHMPASPGGQDEVEDVVLMEGRAAVLFSVKGRVMERKAAREAVSVGTTMRFYENFFFEERGDDHRGGALRLLHQRILRIRAGEFEKHGIDRRMRILPVVVTYDSLGETDVLYRWIEEECRQRGLLQGDEIGPVTLARIDEFEQLMAHAADGRSVVGLLRRREHGDRHRRLDQILGENPLPPNRRRLAFLNENYHSVSARIIQRLFGRGPADMGSRASRPTT